MRFNTPTGAALGALILVFSVACSGTGEPQQGGDAASTVRAFYDHLNAGEYAAAKALYTAETREQIFPDATAEEGFRNWAVGETHDQSLTDFKVVSETEGEDGVTIEFEIGFKDGESSQRTVTVSQEDGAWRMGFIG